jgi:phage tail sheath protein FI
VTEEKSPGVYIEEVSFRARSIEGVSTTTTAFVGLAAGGPSEPTLVTGFSEYESQFSNAPGGYLSHTVRGFFQNGGTRCFVLGVSTDDVSGATLAQLEDLSDISMVCCPDEHTISGMSAALVKHCEGRRDRIAILAAPLGDDLSKAPPAELQSSFAAYYAPWVMVQNPAGGPAIAVHPGGHVVGAIAKNDLNRGVHKAPANLALQGIVGLERNITKSEQDVLNPLGVNVIREFPGRGILIWGARTTSADPEWKYLSVRRYFIYLEGSIDKGTQWAVFEPNGDQLWANVRRRIEGFLLNQWQDGALLGRKPDEAYFVRCDRTTMTQNDLDNGRLVCLIGVAPVKAAEFVIFRIGQWTADAKR